MQHSALQLVNAPATTADAAASASAKPAAKRVASPAAQVAQQRMALVSQTWSSPDFPDASRAAYNALGPLYPVGPTGQTSGRALFISLNLSRLAAGMEILTDLPPQQREMTRMLPAFTLTVVNTGSEFHLNLSTNGLHNGLFLIGCTRPLSSGTTRLRPNDYQAVTHADLLETIPLDIGPEYVSAIGRAAAVGMRVGVCLTPLSLTGFPGVPIYRDALVTAS